MNIFKNTYIHVLVQTCHSIIKGLKKNSTVPTTKLENKAVEIKMGVIDIRTNNMYTGIKLKFLFIKNEYGTNQLFQVFDDKYLKICLNSPKKS